MIRKWNKPPPPARPAASATGQTGAESAAPIPTHSAGLRRFLLACMVTALLGFLALGTWQVQRLFWKRALIERIDSRVHATPVAAPVPSAWPQVSAASHEYLHLRLDGTWLPAKTAKVKAVTVLGSGFWLLTPLRSADGSVTLINRGFVSETAPDHALTDSVASGAKAANDTATVTGLLRMTEPGGGFLRHNDAVGDRWFSRDVQAIAASRQLGLVAPYFIDADATAGQAGRQAQAGEPVGGLTVIALPNNHLVYALTWYALALLTAGAGFWAVRDEQRRRAATPPRYSTESGKQA